MFSDVNCSFVRKTENVTDVQCAGRFQTGQQAEEKVMVSLEQETDLPVLFSGFFQKHLVDKAVDVLLRSKRDTRAGSFLHAVHTLKSKPSCGRSRQ